MSEPRTQAGRDYVAWEGTDDADALDRLDRRLGPHWELIDAILAIEAEALPSVERLARALHRGDPNGPPSNRPWACCPNKRHEVQRAAAILAALRDEP